MPRNKKIKNAQPLVYHGIHFKSKLEKNVYVTLKENGFPARYEEMKFTLWKGFRPTVPFFNKDKSSKKLKLEKKKLLDITYTPDFTFLFRDRLIVIEAKGKENDAFPIKKKLFRLWLEKNEPSSIFFEVYSIKHTLQAIEIIKKL